MVDKSGALKINEESLRIKVIEKSAVPQHQSTGDKEVGEIVNSVRAARADRPLVNAIANAFEPNPTNPIKITGRTTGDTDKNIAPLAFSLHGTASDEGLRDTKITSITVDGANYKLDKPLPIDIEGNGLSRKSKENIENLVNNGEVEIARTIAGFEIPVLKEKIALKKVVPENGASLSLPSDKSGMKVAMAQAAEVNLSDVAKMEYGDKSVANIPSKSSKATGVA